MHANKSSLPRILRSALLGAVATVVFSAGTLYLTPVNITQAVPNQVRAGSQEPLLEILKYWDEIEPYSQREMLTVGVELEGIIPGENRDNAFARMTKELKRRFAQLYPRAAVEVENYDYKTRRGEPRKGTKIIVTQRNGHEIIWHLRDDGSIQAPDGYVGIELVSPILKYQEDIKRYYAVVDTMTASGMKAQENSAALQAHVGFSEDGPLSKTAVTAPAKVAEALVMIWTFAKVEDEIMKHFGVHPKRQKFTMPTPKTILKDISRGEIDIENTNLFDLINNHYNYRYWALNVHSLFQFGTVEVRFANSTTDLDKIEKFLDFSRKIVRAVRTKDTRLLGLLVKYRHESIPLPELATELDMEIKVDFNKQQCERLLE
jgi:hypothetical protein